MSRLYILGQFIQIYPPAIRQLASRRLPASRQRASRQPPATRPLAQRHQLGSLGAVHPLRREALRLDDSAVQYSRARHVTGASTPVTLAERCRAPENLSKGRGPPPPGRPGPWHPAAAPHIHPAHLSPTSGALLAGYKEIHLALRRYYWLDTRRLIWPYWLDTRRYIWPYVGIIGLIQGDTSGHT
jgi:hypothetical protein